MSIISINSYISIDFMLSKDEVQHIAKLARLGLTPSEIKKFQKELSSILDYFEKLKELDVSKVQPTSHSVLVENVMRKDIAESKGKELVRELVEMAPEKKNSHIKVKSVLQ